MNQIQDLFFQLIRVSIGVCGCLSKTPTNGEWKALYDMTKKQSLVGVCFAGVQKLLGQQQAPEEMLYLTWMGMAAKIQQRNEVVNRQCAELTEKFRKDGFDVVVLKGQSAAKRYTVSESSNGVQKVSELSLLRQSGDIDAWVSGSREEIKKYITKKYHVGEVIYNHAHVEVFSDTEVEVHFTPSWLYSPFRNKKLQEWFKGFLVSDGFKVSGAPACPEPVEGLVSKGFSFDSAISTPLNTSQEPSGFKSPSVEFDLVYLMLHAYRHLMHEGMGLRQVMDYYMVLRTVSKGFRSSNEFQMVSKCLKDFGLMNFAGAMMYVIKTVFYGHANDNADDNFFLGIEPDEKRGKRLLAEIMCGGNMGRGDDRTGKSTSRAGYFWEHVSRQWSFLRDYPSEVLWSPLWKTWHFVMRKTGRI